MIIDFHTHTYPDRIAASTVDKLTHAAHTVAFSDGSVAGLVSSMHAAGIDCCVNLPVATAPRQVEHINDNAALINNAHASDGVISFGSIHPEFEDYRAELRRISDLGIPGIKVHPVYQGADIDDLRYLRIFSYAAELGLLILTHAGDDIGFPGVIHCSPKMCRHVMDELGDVPFIFAHMGGWHCWDEVADELAPTSAYIDTAFSMDAFCPMDDGHWSEDETLMLDADTFLSVLRAFGADRVLFGTDSPWASQEDALSFLRALPLRDEERSLILGGNASRLLQKCIPKIIVRQKHNNVE